jgi:hypothetical protein
MTTTYNLAKIAASNSITVPNDDRSVVSHCHRGVPQVSSLTSRNRANNSGGNTAKYPGSSSLISPCFGGRKVLTRQLLQLLQSDQSDQSNQQKNL